MNLLKFPRWSFALLGLLACMLSSPVFATQKASEHWSDEAVELFSTLPVQDGGRVKPMDSFAGLHLLTFNGKRTLKLEDGSKLDQNRWLMDVFFRPVVADTYPCFRVQNDEVIVAMGLEPKAKRAWYSYNELFPGRRKLELEASRAAKTEAIKRDSAQLQTLKLAQDLRAFDGLASLMNVSRLPFETQSPPELAALFGSYAGGLAPLLSKRVELGRLASAAPESESTASKAVGAIFQQFDHGLDIGYMGVTLFPPSDVHNKTWWRPADVLLNSFQGAGDPREQILMLGLLERMDRSSADPLAFTKTLREFHTSTVGLATTRDEYKHIPLEVKLYRWDLFTNSLVFYLLSFILASLAFLAPTKRWLSHGTAITVIIGVSLATAGIVLRCIIRERPPVVTLYDTILFVTSMTVIASVFTEWLTRQRIAMFVAAFLGTTGMFLAGKYELKEVASSGDTMASVVAVLDTNYYLAIHVTTIAMGYAGGLLAAAIAHIWIFGQFFGFRKGDKEFYKGISRMVYGTTCFCLLFSLFGTIMGGVWANDSWGRFWGWDPKENGALLICLWSLVILHARLGGYIRERGMANMAILGGVVVSASWWGVNLLNVGLHSYGFTSGVALTLFTMWGVEAVVLLLSGADALRKAPKESPKLQNP